MPILGIIIHFLAIFLCPNQAMAAEEFDLSYSSTYEVTGESEVSVTHAIGLTNRTSAIYATSFSFDVGLTDIFDITIADRLGYITPTLETAPNRTHIQFNFNDQVAGKNKTNLFTINYKSNDILVKNGSVWELNIPKLEAEHKRSTFDVTLIVPKSLGTPAYISPTPQSRTDQNGKNVFVFSQFATSEPGITALFGDTQYLNFDLTYYLENPLGDDALTRIALPPDTSYQQVMISSLDPIPQNVEVDVDGNWLASYDVPSKSSLVVKALGVAKLGFTPKSSLLTEEQRELYTKPTSLWQSDNETVLSLSEKLKTPKNIYQYVTDHLQYNYAKIDQSPERFGALKALENPQYAICTEFADLYVSLARGAGIATRELEGYAFSTNDKLRPLSLTQDVLHAWVEYYDPSTSTWTQIDPTWGQTTGGIDYFTKLDLNHFVFVVHGASSTDPSPAGAYKNKANPTKDVLVGATTPVPDPTQNLTYSLPQNYNPRDPAILVKNEGQAAVTTEISFVSQNPRVINTQVNLENLPPYGSKEIKIPINFRFTLKPAAIMLNINDGTDPKTLTLNYQKPLTPTSTLAIAAGCFILFATALYAWGLRLRGRSGRLPIHW